jgi:hypothetical protein
VYQDLKDRGILDAAAALDPQDALDIGGTPVQVQE